MIHISKLLIIVGLVAVVSGCSTTLKQRLPVDQTPSPNHSTSSATDLSSSDKSFLDYLKSFYPTAIWSNSSPTSETIYDENGNPQSSRGIHIIGQIKKSPQNPAYIDTENSHGWRKGQMNADGPTGEYFGFVNETNPHRFATIHWRNITIENYHDSQQRPVAELFPLLCPCDYEVTIFMSNTATP